ncbi:PspC domain-containing protein [Enterococcus sp. HY326]|uniref:PspC domain-containing protein n=1 Tax=Enterococcus sp. HY326 TaxID=2971265 RepID=UPI0022405E13|nr:PspC domain-containing protein [Enterococcus sp. HY326]
MKQLRRSSTDKVIAGVCGGLAEYFGAPAIMFRLLFLLPGLVIPYIILALFLPSSTSW